MLRSHSSEIHLLPREERKLNALLAPRVESLKSKVAILSRLFKSLSPIILYAGHDCYEKAIDVNIALSKHQSVLLLPKGKQLHAYNWPAGRNGLTARHRLGIFESHLRRYMTKQTHKKIPDHLVQASAKQLKSRQNINTSKLYECPK